MNPNSGQSDEQSSSQEERKILNGSQNSNARARAIRARYRLLSRVDHDENNKVREENKARREHAILVIPNRNINGPLFNPRPFTYFMAGSETENNDGLQRYIIQRDLDITQRQSNSSQHWSMENHTGLTNESENLNNNLVNSDNSDDSILQSQSTAAGSQETQSSNVQDHQSRNGPFSELVSSLNSVDRELALRQHNSNIQEISNHEQNNEPLQMNEHNFQVISQDGVNVEMSSTDEAKESEQTVNLQISQESEEQRNDTYSQESEPSQSENTNQEFSVDRNQSNDLE